MINVSIFDLIKCVSADSKMHFVNQRSLVENANNLHDNLEYCPKCVLPTECCDCDISYELPDQEIPEFPDDDDFYINEYHGGGGSDDEDEDDEEPVPVLTKQAGVDPIYTVVQRPHVLADALKNASEGGPLPLGLSFWSRILNKICYKTRRWYEFWKPERTMRQPIAFLSELENSMTSKLLFDVKGLEKTEMVSLDCIYSTMGTRQCLCFLHS
jgi:hypothetical protein